MFTTSDATPAYRGYRLQALYTLFRILDNQGQSLVYQPEGKEDLAILDREHSLRQIIQVKQRETNLSLSSFKPDKQNSFFYRVSAELDMNPRDVKVIVVAFGSVGPEIQKAFQHSGPERASVASKIASYGYLSKDKAITVLENAQLEFADEAQLTEKVYKILTDSLPGIDPASAFEWLTHWLYICAENRTEITRSDIVDRINKVGKFVAARAAYHAEWFTSIIPLEDRLSDDVTDRRILAEEFYQGISARYEHILADLDVIRGDKLAAISSAFRDKKVVIIHAASGQGKTTLAYRYLHEFFPEQWRFRISSMGSREQALRVALALTSHADAIGIPLAVYVDVAPRDSDWTELVRALAAHANIQVLVTIREEDWRRANVSGAELAFNAIDLDFDRSEAESIYESLTSKITPPNILDFEEAWIKFGEAGPLLEFIYLVSQGTSLFERLRQQVTNLENEVREGRLVASDLKLLRLVSIASAFEAKLQIRPLAERLELVSPQSTLRLFEKEYLLRISADKSLVGGLHPIRSAILSDLLCDSAFAPWSEGSAACLKHLAEPDVESFLLHAFSRRRQESATLLKELTSYQPQTWTAIVGCIRGLIWLGVAEYIEANGPLIRDASEQVGQGWAHFLDFDITSSSEGIARSWWRDLDIISDAAKKIIENLQARQTDKSEVFSHVRRWLASRTEPSEIPKTELEWEAAAESIFWLQHLDVTWPLREWLPSDAIDRTVHSLSVEALANLILSLNISGQFSDWLVENRRACLDRFRQETLSVGLEDDGHKTTSHFIFDLEKLNEAPPTDSANKIYVPENRFHWEALRRLEMLRKFLPEREQFGSQGYGHLLWEGFLEFDESVKTGLPREHLPLRWLTSVNALLGGLGNQQFRAESWREYAELLLNFRQSALRSLRQLETGLDAYFRRRKPGVILGSEVNPDAWDDCKKMLNNPPLLPKTAVDEWGFVSEASSSESVQDAFSSKSVVRRNGLALQKYNSYLKALGDHMTSLSNFFLQSVDGMVLLPVLGKGGNRDEVLKIANQNGIKTESARLATLNLANAINNLPKFQETVRPLLAPFFGDDSLDKLNKHEKEVFRRVWAMWYFFVAHPSKVTQNASTQFGAEPSSLIRKMRLKLRDALRKLSSDRTKIQLASEELTWDTKPALWITINAHQPWDAYGALGEILAAIQRAVLVGEKDFRKHVLDFYWPYVVIVPLVRERYISPVAWRLPLPIVLGKDDSSGFKWWNLAQHKIPQKALDHFGFRGWELSSLAPGQKLLESTATVFSLAGHLRDFKRLPDLDEKGLALLQGYVDRVNNQLSEALQSAFNAQSEILSACSALSEAELETRPALVEAGQAAIELRSLMLPSADFEGEKTLTIGELIEWSTRLEQAPAKALVCALDWTADVLDQITPH